MGRKPPGVWGAYAPEANTALSASTDANGYAWREAQVQA